MFTITSVARLRFFVVKRLNSLSLDLPYTGADSFTSFLGLKISKCSRSFCHFARSSSEFGLLSVVWVHVAGLSYGFVRRNLIRLLNTCELPTRRAITETTFECVFGCMCRMYCGVSNVLCGLLGHYRHCSAPSWNLWLVPYVHHVSKVIPPGLFFVRRIINLLVAFRSPVIRFGSTSPFARNWLGGGNCFIPGTACSFFFACHPFPTLSIYSWAPTRPARPVLVSSGATGGWLVCDRIRCTRCPSPFWSFFP